MLDQFVSRHQSLIFTKAVTVANVVAKRPAAQIYLSATNKPITTNNPLKVLLANTTYSDKSNNIL